MAQHRVWQYHKYSIIQFLYAVVCHSYLFYIIWQIEGYFEFFV